MSNGIGPYLNNVAVNQHLTITSPALADFDGNGVVGIDDLLTVIGHWGPSTGGDRKADMDNNGVVNIDDLLTVLNAWTS